MTLQEKGQSILDMLVNIRKLREQQEALWRELEDQAALMLQGIDPQEVRGLVYDPLKDKRRHRPEMCHDNRPGFYNVVKMKDGSEIILNPMIPVRKRSNQ
jgi:hypothetical protein